MKRITYSSRGVLVGDDAADTITRYAAVLARHASADSVDLTVLGRHGEAVGATFVLDSGTVLMAEATKSELPEPDNAEVIARMRAEIDRLESPRVGHPLTEEIPGFEQDLGF